jgi:hypothetical protein
LGRRLILCAKNQKTPFLSSAYVLLNQVKSLIF